MSLPNELLPVGLLGTGAATGGYQIERSLRFNSSDSAYLSRTMSSASSTYTLSMWVKRSTLASNYKYLFSSGNAGIAFYNGTDQFYIFDGGTVHATTGVYRDTSAWYHILLSVNSNTGAAYINSTQVLSGKNTASLSTTANATNIGRYYNSGSGDFYFDGYIADVYLIDGQALDPTSFTEVSATTGQLIPKAYTGSFGTNGFWLKFSDNSAATATTLGKDYSGNSNNWTPNNLSVFSATKSGAGSVTAGAPFNSSFPWTTAFDGAIDLTGAVSNASGANSFVWTFASTLTGTTAAFVVHDTYVPDFDTGNKAAINGTALTSSNWTKTTNTLPVASGAAGDYKVYTYSLGGSPLSTVGVGNAVRIAAVLLDGIPLIFDLSGTNDSLVDTPTSGSQVDTGLGGQVTGNYCTLNPLAKGGDIQAPTNGNLQVTSSGSGYGLILGTIGMSSGKWYWEVTTTSANCATGIATNQANLASYGGADAYSWVWASYSGGSSKRNNGSQSSYGSILANGDVVGIAFDADNGTLTFYKNNVSQGAAYTGLVAGTYLPVLGDETASANIDLTVNFGQRPWAYQAPANHRPLVDTLLPSPVVAKSSDYFQTVLWTGNSSTQTVSGLSFSPDLVWLKCRNDAYGHRLLDTVRGATIGLASQSTAAESTESTGLTAFNSDGFTLGSNVTYNESAKTYVGWAFDAGTTTTTNAAGSITSQVRASASSGFSIVSYTAAYTGSARTVGHGLGVKPSLIILKNRSDGSANWRVYHSASGASLPLILNSTAAAASNFGIWDNTEPTSSVFTVGINTDVGGNIGSGDNLIAYCFAPVAGYSSFGSYTGNGSADGTFVYTGFRVKWYLVKQSSASGENWRIIDATRSPYNVAQDRLLANNSAAEGVQPNEVDFLSNGFKFRSADGAYNGSGATYIYAAFAESPFQYARAR